MARESEWRLAARQALLAAVARGTTQGLSGEALEKHARATGYPFGERAMTPYKLWCDEARRMFGAMHGPDYVSNRPVRTQDERRGPGPVRVLKLRPDHNADRMLWLGRVTLGDWLLVQYQAGELVAVVAEREYQLSHGRACFREQIAEADSMTCSLSEAAGILEAAKLFDFSAIDLASCEGEPHARGAANA